MDTAAAHVDGENTHDELHNRSIKVEADIVLPAQNCQAAITLLESERFKLNTSLQQWVHTSLQHRHKNVYIRGLDIAIRMNEQYREEWEHSRIVITVTFTISELRISQNRDFEAADFSNATHRHLVFDMHFDMLAARFFSALKQKAMSSVGNSDKQQVTQ